MSQDIESLRALQEKHLVKEEARIYNQNLVKALFAKGLGYSTIEKRTGIHRSTIRNWVKKMGGKRC